MSELVMAFNNRYEDVIHPSGTLCIAESFSRWYGLGGHWMDIGLPHYVRMDRKPEAGWEFQTLCYGRSGLLLDLK